VHLAYGSLNHNSYEKDKIQIDPDRSLHIDGSLLIHLRYPEVLKSCFRECLQMVVRFNNVIMKHTYGLKSISIGFDPGDISPVDFYHEPSYRPEMVAMPVFNGIDKIFQLDTSGTVDLGSFDVNPKMLRMLFGNKFNKPPKQVVCRFKLKNKRFSRPVYMTFVFPTASVDTKEKWKSISDFVKACYQ
jgi:hypothetical protein